MTSFVIGVDGGGSKTEAVVLDERGLELGRWRGGSSNFHLAGRKGAGEALVAAMQGAAGVAGVHINRAAAVVWALAGVGRPEEARTMRTLQANLLPNTPGMVVTDALAALVGGAGARYGVVVIAGTGMIAYGEDDADASARAGGWGHLLDGGSGYAIAMHALQAIARAEDGGELPTRLSERIRDALGLPSSQNLIHWLYAPERKVSEIAGLAPLALDAAQAGDLIATDIAVEAAEALAASVEAVTRRLNLHERPPFPLVLAGGLLTGNEFFRTIVKQSIHTRVPAARPQLPRYDAATGAGLLALEMLGHPLASFDEASGSKDGAWASERRNILTNDLDTRTTLELAGLMHIEDKRAVAAIRPNLPAIAETIDAIAARMKKGGRLIYVGAGTSGRLGVLDASECPPTFNTDPDQVAGVIAGGRRALTEAVEEAEDNPEDGARAMQELAIGPQDSVVGIAASGRTPFVMGALAEARRRDALTVALICNLPAPMAEIADYVLAPLVGPEVITGSTRLKAGTAQKLILNMLSTGVMVRLGKTYGNLMVDVQQLNAKLQVRARRIVAQACGITEETAAAALRQSNGDVKIAIVSTLLDCSPAEAQQRLQHSDGNVRLAIDKSLRIANGN